VVAAGEGWRRLLEQVIAAHLDDRLVTEHVVANQQIIGAEPV
jgi:hypothetical protein